MSARRLPQPRVSQPQCHRSSPGHTETAVRPRPRFLWHQELSFCLTIEEREKREACCKHMGECYKLLSPSAHSHSHKCVRTAATATARILQERKSWRKDKPFGFVAKPSRRADEYVLAGHAAAPALQRSHVQKCSSDDIMVWHCSIPGKAGTAWEGGQFPVRLGDGNCTVGTSLTQCMRSGV